MNRPHDLWAHWHTDVLRWTAHSYTTRLPPRYLPQLPLPFLCSNELLTPCGCVEYVFLVLYCMWQLVRLHICTSVCACAFTQVCTRVKMLIMFKLYVNVFVICTAEKGAARSGPQMFMHGDCVTSFIPVRIVGIICNLTTAGCQKATNGTYEYVWFTALVMLSVLYWC